MTNATIHNPVNSGFRPAAKLASLSWGSAADWYIAANADACRSRVPGERIGSKMWPRGYFAVVKFTNHDEMRDFGVNEECERVVSGPYASEEEALAAAEQAMPEMAKALS